MRRLSRLTVPDPDPAARAETDYPRGVIAVHHLCVYGGPYAGSFVPMLAGTARENDRRGNDTTVWLPASVHDREWVAELSRTVRLRWLPEGDDVGLRQVAATLRAGLAAEDRPTILHTHFSGYDAASLLVGAPRRRTAIVWHEHGRPAADAGARVRALVKYGVLARSVARILCVSAEITEDLRVRHAPARALTTFPNAVDLARFAPADPAARAQARASLGIAPDARVVLHFSWDWERKGGDLVLAAAPLLADPNIIWITVPGPPESAAGPALEESGRLRALSARGDVRELYAASDVLLSCSRSEGMPYAMLEALACGLPVVASDLPGHRPALEELPGGFICQLSPEAIGATVGAALGLEPAARERHARAARERISLEYSLDDWARRLGDLYDAALGLTT